MAQKYLGGGQYAVVGEDGSGSGSGSGPAQISPAEEATPMTQPVTDADAEALKEFVEAETIIEGEAKVTPMNLLMSGQNCVLSGLGSRLSGMYHMTKVRHIFSKDDGYSQTVTVERSGFGKFLKKGENLIEPTIPAVNGAITPAVVNQKYSMVSGDSLWAIAQAQYGDGSLWTKIAEANGIAESELTSLPVGKELVIPK